MKGLGWKLGLVVAAIGAGVATGAGPWRLAERERHAVRRDAAEAGRAERLREEMVRKEATLRSPLGREALARKSGYLKPGEMPAPPVVDTDR